MQVHVTLRKRNLDIFSLKGFVYLVVELMDQPAPVFGPVSPAQQFEFKGGIAEVTKPHPRFGHEGHQVIVACN